MGNRMGDVAALFGKELDERFTIRMYNRKLDAKFMQNGLLLMDAHENLYIDVNAFVLMDLLTGRAEIVEDEE